MPVRIELFDAGPEAGPVAVALLGAGFEVAVRALPHLATTSASVAVVGGDQPGALEAIRALRDDGANPDTPVVMLGVPAGTGHRGEGPGFGAEAVLLRPAPIAQLVAEVRRLARGASHPPHGGDVEARPERTHAPVETGISRRDEPGARRAPERTMQLPGAGLERGERTGSTRTPLTNSRVLTPIGGEHSSAGLSVSGVGSAAGSASGVSTGGGSRGPSASISDTLRGLLERADRRAFPARAPIDLSLPGSDEPAHALVPSELLEHDDLAFEFSAEDDPIDAYTYVGGLLSASGEGPRESLLPAAPSLMPPPPGRELGAPAEDEVPGEDEADPERPQTSPGTPWSLSRRPRARSSLRPGAYLDRPSFDATLRGVPVEREPSAKLDAPDASGVPEMIERAVPPEGLASSLGAALVPSSIPAPEPTSEPAGTDLEQRGRLRPGRALELLSSACIRGLSARITLRPEGDGAPTVAMIAAGELVALDGPADEGALAWLAARGIAVPQRVSTAQEDALRRAVREGLVTAFAAGRAHREGLLALLRAWLRADDGTFEIERLAPHERPGKGPLPLGAPLASTLLAEARRALDATALERWVGADASLRPGPTFADAAQRGWLSPELVDLLSTGAGRTFSWLAAQAPEEPGLAGVVACLLATRALVASPGVAASAGVAAAPSPAAVLARLAHLAARAEDGDYFAMLGLGADAGEAAVHDARDALRAEVLGLPLEALGLEVEHGGTRDAVLDAIDEAHRVLSIDRWRGAYRDGLARSARLAEGTPTH